MFRIKKQLTYSDILRSKKPRTGKTVRIISPHSAASDNANRIPDRLFSGSGFHPASPPPEPESTPSSDEEPPEDPFGAESDGGGTSTEDEGTRQNTLTNKRISQSSTQGSAGTPANPFKKIPTILETEDAIGTQGSFIGHKPPAETDSASKPHYDVDGFKKLLLTGEKNDLGASVTTAPPVSFTGQHHQPGDSSSSTDASSVSRQSISEAAHGPLHDSPRTSFEVSPSDDERQRLVGIQQQNAQKVKPSATRHRHGRLVKANAPQTVSFEDPILSFSISTLATTPGQSTPKSPGSPSDVDKPLPPLPGTSINSNMDPTKKTSSFDPSEPQDTTTPQKKDPPAPPLSRRHSQLRPKSFISNSGRSPPISEETSKGPKNLPHPLAQPPPSAGSKPPPPPPPRRSGLLRGNSFSSTPSLSDQHCINDANSKPTPPVPPTRRPSISSSKRPAQVPSNSSSPSLPPQPPPRRRGSSQSSYNPSRSSGDYRALVAGRNRADSGVSSISQLPMSYTEHDVDKKDVMADLSALQKEVDELRSKFKERY